MGAEHKSDITFNIAESHSLYHGAFEQIDKWHE